MNDTLEPKEPHPAISLALDYYKTLSLERLLEYKEHFASLALANNRTSQICLGTLNRLLTNDKVSDKYFLGLMWVIREMEKHKDLEVTKK